VTDRPNIVLVTVDSLRADHCSFAGYDRETTPTLDRMARRGTNFTNAVAPGPSTPESMPAIFTGRYMTGDVGRSNLATAREEIYRHMTVRDPLPQRLSRMGYATAGFTPNPFTSRHFGYDRGFDHFRDFMESVVRRNYGRLFERVFRGNVAFLFRIGLNFWQREEVFKPWEAYYDDAMSWAGSVDEPYFLWLHLMDPHIPYVPPRKYRTQSTWGTYYANYRFWRGDKESGFPPDVHDRLTTAYDDSIRYTDACLEAISRDTDDETVVVVHGDHGEAFGEHGTYGHEPYLFDENVHVPLVVDGGPERTVADPTSLRSIPSLLTRLAAGDGADACEDAAGPFATSRTRQGNRSAVCGRRFKYIVDGSTATLYDRADGEQRELADAELQTVAERLATKAAATEAEERAIRSAADEVNEP
jgi:arylsulfatase